ncbi:hypothetical protein KY275_21355 [Enterobacter hormaechei]|uniref:hypothetical protein n=1 Tax=Enterobacter hormaechei TaxID=158836 RepID=UPI001C5B45E4|nr:hypothetical protein [Enterobacter hormaechei]QXZ32365.1 hypothetical protein KY275_21355 [Enterobacter hormaechei]
MNTPMKLVVAAAMATISISAQAGALAEMSGALAGQQKTKLADSFVDIVSRHGGKVSYEQAYKQADMMLSELDATAKQKGKSCLLIARDWRAGEEAKFKEELKGVTDTKKKELAKEFANVVPQIAVDYIKYKCLENSEFLNK